MINPIQPLIRLLGALLLTLLLVCQPAWADPSSVDQSPQAEQKVETVENAVGEPIQQATDSDLSDIPNLERVDYERFRETFGEVPGEHVPLINPNNEKVKVKQKNSSSGRMTTTGDLQQR
jgi:hypothetical protein